MHRAQPKLRLRRWAKAAALLVFGGSLVYIAWKCLGERKQARAPCVVQCLPAERPLVSYPQITYLNPHSAPPTHSQFPCLHMPVPEIDPRKVFYKTDEVLRLMDIVSAVIKACPSWKMLNKKQINSMAALHRAGKLADRLCVISSRLKELSGYKYLTRSMEDTLCYSDILKDRIFPTVSRPMSCKRCFPYDFMNVIAPSPNEVCQQGKKPVDVVIIVTTVPGNARERTDIRRSWGSVRLRRKHRFGLIFLFGAGWPDHQVLQLTHENERHHDILMDSFKDNYFNLTQKVLMGFKWVLEQCPQVKFLIRGADDTWVDIPAVFGLIRRFGHHETFQKYQVGDCFTTLEPFRGPDFKTFTNTLEYKEHIFPPYALGTVFLTSHQLTQDLVDAAPDVPYFPIEDVYFGLVLTRLGSGCHHIRGMNGKYTVHRPPPDMKRKLIRALIRR